MPEPGFFSRLKERKLVQWALAYLAGAFVVFQAVEVLAEPWGISTAAQRTIHLLLVVGLLVALVLAWYHGEKGHQRVTGLEAATVSVLLVLAGGALWVLPRDETSPRPTRDRVSFGSTEQKPSIAVLPFANLSSDPSASYLADAMTETLITELSKIEGLRVTSRESVMRYKDTVLPPKEVATALMVDGLIGGSAFLFSDSIRITAHLLDATHEDPLWADQYSGALSEVFPLSGEVARAIAESVRVQLTPQDETRISANQAVHADAFRMYAEGLQLRYQEGATNYERAAFLFQQATEADPEFALAFARLALSQAILIGIYGYPRGTLEPSARKAAARSLELNPGLSEGYVAQGVIQELVDMDWRAAEQSFLAAIRLNPGSLEPRLEYALLLGRFTDDRDRTLAEFQKALDLDPVSIQANGAITEALLRYREYEEAIEHCRRVLSIEPDQFITRYRLGNAYIHTDRMEEGLQEFERLLAAERTPFSLSGVGFALGILGRTEEARVILTELREDWPDHHHAQALVYGGLGEWDAALDAFEAHVASAPVTFPGVFKTPFFDPIRSDPRFQSLVDAVLEKTRD